MDDGPRETRRFWLKGPTAQGSRSLGGSRAPRHGGRRRSRCQESRRRSLRQGRRRFARGSSKKPLSRKSSKKPSPRRSQKKPLTKERRTRSWLKACASRLAATRGAGAHKCSHKVGLLTGPGDGAAHTRGGRAQGLAQEAPHQVLAQGFWLEARCAERARTSARTNAAPHSHPRLMEHKCNLYCWRSLKQRPIPHPRPRLH